MTGNAPRADDVPFQGEGTAEGPIPLPPDGPDEEASAGARPSGSVTRTTGPHIVGDSRPGLVVGLVLLAIFLLILGYAVAQALTR